jgi:hypothetical protein
LKKSGFLNFLIKYSEIIFGVELAVLNSYRHLFNIKKDFHCKINHNHKIKKMQPTIMYIAAFHEKESGYI